MARRINAWRTRREAAKSHDALAARVLALADRYEAAGLGEPTTPPVPWWIGEIAAEVRGLVDGAVL